jgi:hypothetical protein
MGTIKDPFEPLLVTETGNEFDMLCQKPIDIGSVSAAVSPVTGAVIARLHGFDLDDRPIVAGLAELPGELVCARSTVPLTMQQIGREVVVLLERGDARAPIIMGVLQPTKSAPLTSASGGVSIHVDDERYTITAEREIVLRCGDSSITLTRAGKVLIKGNYILSRATGYNKIKGAAVDIN